MADALPHGLTLIGQWTKDLVTLRWVPEPNRSWGWQKDVTKHWDTLTAEAPYLFDAPVAALWGVRVEDDERLTLSLSESQFRTGAATHANTRHYVLQHGKQGLGNSLACALSLICPEGLVLAKRSKDVFGGQGQLHPIAGHFNPQQHLDQRGRPCAFAAMLTELREELTLTGEDIGELTLTGVQYHPVTRKPELHFHTVTPLPLASLRQRLARAEDASETEALTALDATATAALAQDAPGTATPIAHAAAHLVRTLALL